MYISWRLSAITSYPSATVTSLRRRPSSGEQYLFIHTYTDKCTHKYVYIGLARSSKRRNLESKLAQAPGLRDYP